MNHTAWCSRCNRWRTWSVREGVKHCVKCSHPCTSRFSGKPAQFTGVSWKWLQRVDFSTGKMKLVREEKESA